MNVVLTSDHSNSRGRLEGQTVQSSTLVQISDLNVMHIMYWGYQTPGEPLHNDGGDH